MRIEKIVSGLALALGMLALGLGIYAWVRPPLATELASYGPSPTFSFIDSQGKKFESSQLKGKVWLASFIYTQCKDTCPMIAAQLKRISELLPDSPDFKLVSISVDPRNDTPEKLAAYARDLGAEGERWIFLTGPEKEMFRVVSEGFKLVAREKVAATAKGVQSELLHSSRLVLVDQAGEIRGYFDGLLGSSAREIGGQARLLLKKS